MSKNVGKEIDCIVAYLKYHKVEDMDTYTLFHFLDFLRENKEAYIKYSGRTDFNSKLMNLWNGLGIVISYCIFIKSNLIISLLIGAGFISLPNITLSKINTMEYNELVARINDTINKNLREEESLERKIINSSYMKEG